MLRRVAAPSLLALLLCTLAVPPGAAQTGPDVAVEDAKGDAGGTTGDPAGRTAPLDVLGLDVREDAVGFTFALRLAALAAGPSVPLAEATVYRTQFTFDGVAYQVRLLAGGSLAGPVQATLLSDPTGGSSFEAVAPLDHRQDTAAQAIVVEVPRNVLVARDGAPAFAGQALTAFWVETSGGAATAPGSGDRAPDQGVSATSVPVRFGLRQSGHVRLASPEPFRASNGEAGTFRYQVEATNTGAAAARFVLAAEAVPAGWRVRLPADELAIEAGATLPLTAEADVPFAHSHGRLATFALRLEDRADASSVGRILLGILYSEPAQPAGHHDTLVVHSREGPGIAPLMAKTLGSAGGGVEAYMNTLVDDPSDAGTDVPPAYVGEVVSTATTTSATWLVPLSPRLGLGLDFDVAGTGEVLMPFVSPLPLPGAVLTGSLRLSQGNATPGPGMGIALAELLPAAPVDVATQPTGLVAGLVPLPSSDYVPHRPGQNLWLELTLTYARPDAATGPATPHLRPGGTLRLPLLEYSDQATPGADAGTATDGADGGDGPSGDAGAPGQASGRGTPASGLPSLLGLLALGAAWRARRR